MSRETQDNLFFALEAESKEFLGMANVTNALIAGFEKRLQTLPARIHYEFGDNRGTLIFKRTETEWALFMKREGYNYPERLVSCSADEKLVAVSMFSDFLEGMIEHFREANINHVIAHTEAANEREGRDHAEEKA